MSVPVRDVPSTHTHWTIGTVAIVAFFLAVVAIFVGVTVSVLGPADTSAGESVLPTLTPKAQLKEAPESEINVSYAPNVPPAPDRRDQAIVDVHFVVVEGVTDIGPDGVRYETWGYKIDGSEEVSTGTPGPMIRARVGDVLRFTITNPETNTNPHNVDFHAVTGQGGGAADTTVVPGETVTIEARLLYPGMFLYHCAHGDVPLHISHGMYGGILVDPEDPLPDVDHEWYVVQSEYYTTSTEPGVVETDRAAITDELPTFVVFNGAVGAIAGDNSLQMNVGERGRIYFVNAGLNLISSFHPIGSHWDTVYQEGALLSPPVRGSQTTLVPAGGGVVVEIIGQVPSTVLLVDHALARTFDKGALGMIVISGDPNPELFEVVTPQPDATSTTVAGASGDFNVDILPGSWEVQEMNSPDEFSDNETPRDFSINVLRVHVGDTVTWTQKDPGMLHTVTSSDGLFDSGFLEGGDTFSYTFDQTGEYEYFCTPHPWMRAKVIVE